MKFKKLKKAKEIMNGIDATAEVYSTDQSFCLMAKNKKLNEKQIIFFYIFAKTEIFQTNFISSF